MSHDDGELAWLPERGVELSREDLVSIMRSLKALTDDTLRFDIDRIHVLDILRTIEIALKRTGEES